MSVSCTFIGLTARLTGGLFCLTSASGVSSVLFLIHVRCWCFAVLFVTFGYMVIVVIYLTLNVYACGSSCSPSSLAVVVVGVVVVVVVVEGSSSSSSSSSNSSSSIRSIR